MHVMLRLKLMFRRHMALHLIVVPIALQQFGQLAHCWLMLSSHEPVTGNITRHIRH